MSHQEANQVPLITAGDYAHAYANGGFRRTVSTLRRLGASLSQAEDLAQEAWGAQGWTKRHQLKDANRLVQWATSIAVNRFRDGAARDRRLTTFPPVGLEPNVCPNPTPDIIDLHRALLRCSKRQRALIEAVHIQGNTPADMAAALKISNQAVLARLSRARRTLRRAMTTA